MGHPHQPFRQVRPDDVTNLKLKAEGAGAAVYQGFLGNNDNKLEQVALRKPRITSSTALLRFEAELELRSGLHHPNVLPLIAACSTPPHYCTVSPWKAGGTLFDLIHTNSVNMSFKRLLQLSLQFANALSYLHSRNLVHRDLKTANILLDETWENLVVADLDLLADVSQLRTAASKNAGRALHRGPSNGRLSHMVGTLVYMAPEVLSGKPHSFAADVYAFGITINEMARAAVPFVDRKMPVPELHTVLETRFNEVRLRGAIVKNGLRPVLATGVSPEFSQLVERCWQHDPEKRSSFETIVSELQGLLDRGDEYLNKFDGSTLPSMDPTLSIGDTNGQISGINGVTPREKQAQLLIDEFRISNETPTKPIWYGQSVVRENQSESSAVFDVHGDLSSTCGDRGEDSMEDRSLVIHEAAALPSTHLFAVFDGHGGQACAEFAMRHFPGALYRRWNTEEATPESALVHAFEDIDYAFLNSTMQDGVNGAGDQSGCTALVALLVDCAVYVANAGDCRCVLGRTDGTALALSKDHVATDASETARIAARGGFVSMSGRAQGVLMVSRAFGDRKVKRYISATPDVVEHHFTDDDDFLILASDGLWDVVSNQEACAMVRSTVRVADMAAKRLAGKALELGSDDNISVIVVFLRGTVSYSSV